MALSHLSGFWKTEGHGVGHEVGGGRGVYYVEDVAEALWHEANVGCLAPHEEEESDVDHVTAVAAATAAAASTSTPGEKGWGYIDTGGGGEKR